MQKRNLKKFILMIVEGKSDKKYLYPVDKIVKEKNCFIEFKITNGDILSDKDTTPKNVTIKIGLAVQSFLDYSKLLFENIFQVVHIVDLDGVFIKDDNVITDSSLNDGETIYSRNDIKNINRDNIIRRNKKKRDCLNLLYKLNEIPYGYENKLPYKIYYFSTNIDDYFVGDQNSDLDKKN